MVTQKLAGNRDAAQAEGHREPAKSKRTRAGVRRTTRASITLRPFAREVSVDVPETVEIEPGGGPDGAVIWLHGLGADGHDFEPIVPELRLDGQLALRFVFPHAPVRPVTINGGMAMRAWYDILTLERGGPQDETGIRASGELLRALIEREHERGIPYERILLAGFSQGGAIALHTALRFPQPLAGLMALSTYLPLQSAFNDDVLEDEQSQTRDLPVFMAHGSFDPVLPIALGQHTRDLLNGSGYRVEWRDYPMAHAVCAEEITDIRRWLLSVYVGE
jgi:phospholipase/carboxylesterase